jgi:hypothetical protein
MPFPRIRFCVLLATLILAGGTRPLAGQNPTTRLADVEQTRDSTDGDLSETTADPFPPVAKEHPLLPALRYAQVRLNFVEKNLQDFTCLLVKRERIDGRLRDHEYIRTSARSARIRQGEVTAPFAVYMHYLGPRDVKGRKVLYVQGQNENKMLVRNGGKRFSYITVKVDPEGEAARRESRHPITQLSPQNMARLIIEKIEDDMLADPTGENTEVTFYLGAKVDGRTCTHFHVVHPRRDDNLSFHAADVYVDDELHVPVRVEGYEWPKKEGDDPVLVEEYTFTRLQINVGLTDANFSASLVGR